MIDVDKLYNLSYLIRYSNVKRIKNESVAEHSFFVAVEVMKLYEEYDFDLGRALGMALVHDFAECDVDDVNHMIKEKYPEIASALKVAEKDAVSSYPDFIKELIDAYEVNDGSVEHLIVHIADAAQCITYSNNEIQLGNKGYMLKVNEESKRRVREMIKTIPNKYRRIEEVVMTISQFLMKYDLSLPYSKWPEVEHQAETISIDRDLEYGYTKNDIGDSAGWFNPSILAELLLDIS